MIEASSPADARARHWTIDAILGASVALAAITVAQAALPERVPKGARPVVASQPRLQAQLASTPAEPAYLVAFQDPVEGREIISPFGLRQLPWEENGRLHEGVDIAAPFGSPVLAAADGVVLDAGRSDTYGRYVRIGHAEGLTTLYAHMGAVAEGMTPGRALKAGEAVGRIGSSGTSTGPHLHLELRDSRDRPLNPDLFLGRQFASADDLPLKSARRVPRGVRVAWVSNIPKNKRELMLAKLEADPEAKDAALAAKDVNYVGGYVGKDVSLRSRLAAPGKKMGGVTVYYGDGRPHATFPVGKNKPADAADDAPIATVAEAPAA